MKALFFRAVTVAALLASFAGADPFYRYVRVPIGAVSSAGPGFIRDHKWDDTYAFGYVKRDGRALPEGAIELDAWDWATHDYDPKTLTLRHSAEDAPFVGPYEEFHTYETLTSDLHDLAAKYPSLVTLASAGKTVKGRELWYVRLSGKAAQDPNKPKLFFISSMHGDEVTGKEMMVYLIRELLEGYGSDSRLTALLDYSELWILPSMNPDGTEQRQRWNANGVDLNRNFPDPLKSEAEAQAVETQALMRLFSENHFVTAMNFHGGSLVVNIPWDGKPNPESDRFGDDNLVMHLAHLYADNNGPMHNNTQGSFVNGITYGYEWYQVLGGMQDFSNVFHQSTHATLEISETKWPSASQLPKFWDDNRESMLSYLEGGMTGVHLKVVDAAGKPVAAEVDISTATRTLKYPSGVVHRPTVPGKQQVTVKAPGFRRTSLTVDAAKFDGRYQTVTLARE